MVGLLVAIAVIAGSVTVLVRERDTGDDASRQRPMLIRLLILLGGLTIVGIISTSRVFGEFFDYVIRWWWVIAAWIFLACVLVLIRRLRADLVVVGALLIAALTSASRRPTRSATRTPARGTRASSAGSMRSSARS